MNLHCLLWVDVLIAEELARDVSSYWQQADIDRTVFVVNFIEQLLFVTRIAGVVDLLSLWSCDQKASP